MVTIRDVAKQSGFSSTTVSIVLNDAPLARYIPPVTKKRIERYLEMLLDRRIEGLVVLANWLFLDINLLADLEKSSIPTALIGCELKGDSMSSVIVDNELGGYLALEHLHALGHRKIAVIRGPKTLADSSPRWRGIRKCARACGVELDSRMVVDLPESRDPLSSFEMGQKLTENLIKQKRQFTALLAFDDMTAFGAIRALGKAGLRVPEHCSVIGFDDVAASALCTPPLTTVRQPMEAMGTDAVGIVLEGINYLLEKREVTAHHRKVAPELVVRESTRALL